MSAAQEAAKTLVTRFRARHGVGKFPYITRDGVARGLMERIDKPGAIFQTGSVCAPATLLFTIALDKPTRYAQFIIDLYEKGRGKLGNLFIEPGGDTRRITRDARRGYNAADWIGLASIRDSENWFFDYQKATGVHSEAAGITFPYLLTQWFNKVGYTEVINDTNLVRSKDRINALKASSLHNLGYKVSLLINHQLLKPKKQTKWSLVADHWVVLTSGIKLVPKVQFTVYSWAERFYKVPHDDHPDRARRNEKFGTDLTEDDFLENYFGYVACRR